MNFNWTVEVQRLSEIQYRGPITPTVYCISPQSENLEPTNQHLSGLKDGGWWRDGGAGVRGSSKPSFNAQSGWGTPWWEGHDLRLFARRITELDTELLILEPVCLSPPVSNDPPLKPRSEK
ncbi:hypothetical protein E2C01_011559 [Portunus trituberculatus]|uniref:Uncharacterized protein n=1 Tax=Portunus trituberculatus TaxID=210409 RepID=A0A5B7DC53_PORTR|nr:hypothetical protein [Portunus trituberculatus]